eukprot:1157567-Pelagomonas_calceolata.AAC.9
MMLAWLLTQYACKADNGAYKAVPTWSSITWLPLHVASMFIIQINGITLGPCINQCRKPSVP